MPEPPRPDNTTGLILAGGLSRRMGRPKAWARYQGQPLVAWVAQRLQAQTCAHLLNTHPQDTRSLPGWQVVHDQRPGFPGPLAGLETGLIHARTPWLLVAPCDMPALPPNLLNELTRHWQAGDRLLTARTQERHFPVVGLVHQSLLPVIQQHLQQGKRRLMDWQRACEGKWCLFDDEQAFININHPEQLSS